MYFVPCAPGLPGALCRFSWQMLWVLILWWKPCNSRSCVVCLPCPSITTLCCSVRWDKVVPVRSSPETGERCRTGTALYSGCCHPFNNAHPGPASGREITKKEGVLYFTVWNDLQRWVLGSEYLERGELCWAVGLMPWTERVHAHCGAALCRVTLDTDD